MDDHTKLIRRLEETAQAIEHGEMPWSGASVCYDAVDALRSMQNKPSVISEVRKVMKAATNGPYSADEHHAVYGFDNNQICETGTMGMLSRTGKQQAANAKAIVMALNMLPELLDIAEAQSFLNKSY